MSSSLSSDILHILEAVPAGPYRVVRGHHQFMGDDPTIEALYGVVPPENEICIGEIYLVHDSIQTFRQRTRDGKGLEFKHEIVLYPFWMDGPIKFAMLSWFSEPGPLLVPASAEEVTEEWRRHYGRRRHPKWDWLKFQDRPSVD